MVGRDRPLTHNSTRRTPAPIKSLSAHTETVMSQPQGQYSIEALTHPTFGSAVRPSDSLSSMTCAEKMRHKATAQFGLRLSVDKHNVSK